MNTLHWRIVILLIVFPPKSFLGDWCLSSGWKQFQVNSACIPTVTPVLKYIIYYNRKKCGKFNLKIVGMTMY